MIWRFLKSLFTKTAAQKAAEEAYRAKRAAQRKEQRARKRMSATPSATPDVSPATSPVSPATSGDIRRHVGDMSATVGDTPLIKKKNINIGGARISDRWRPDQRGLDLAIRHFGDRAEIEIQKFIDYWLSQSGPRAERPDEAWQAQFRWWVQNAANRQPQLPLGGMSIVQSGEHHGRRSAKRPLTDTAADLAAQFREIERNSAADLGGDASQGGAGDEIGKAVDQRRDGSGG